MQPLEELLQLGTKNCIQCESSYQTFCCHVTPSLRHLARVAGFDPVNNLAESMN